jgi:preprotein translocase subunit SecD
MISEVCPWGQVKRNRANWLAWISIGLLFGSILACSAPPLVLPFKPAAVLTIAPDPQVSVSATDRDAAYRVVEKRLDYAFGSGDVRVIRKGEQLLIEVRDAKDDSLAARLAIAPGLLTLVDSAEALPEGGPVPQDGRVILTGADFANARATKDSLGRFQIEFTLKPPARQILADYTRQSIGRYLVIVVDGQVISSPSIQSEITVGEGVISGNFTEESAMILQVQITNGALPVPLVVLENKLAP